MSDQIRPQDKSLYSEPASRPSNNYEAIGRGTAWAYFFLLGFWLRAAVFILFFVAGAVLVAAFPIAVLEEIGVIRWHIINIAGITYQSGLLYVAAGAVLSIIGVFWFAAGYALRRWIFSRPS